LVDVLLDLVDVALVGHFVADAVFVEDLVEYFVVVDVTVIVETWTLWVTVTGTLMVIVVVLAGFVTVEVVVVVTTGGVCVVVVVLKTLVGTTTVIRGVVRMSVGTETVTGGTSITIAEVEDGDGTGAGAPQAPSTSMRLVSSVTAPPRA
jgi:hypothetical protein